MALTTYKEDLADKVRRQLTRDKVVDLSKEKAVKVVNEVLTQISLALGKGNNVQFTGFGSFKVKQQSARKVPTGVAGSKETVEIPAKAVVKFKAGRQLADRVKFDAEARKLLREQDAL